jgi:hypothetical protein
MRSSLGYRPLIGPGCPFWFLGMYSQWRRCRLVGIGRNFLLNRCITGFDPYTANLDHAHGQDPKR